MQLVAVLDDAELAVHFREEWTVIVDPGRTLSDNWGVVGTPHVTLIDHHGTVAYNGHVNTRREVQGLIRTGAHR